MKGMSMGLKEALGLVMENIRPLAREEVSLVDSIDRVAAMDLYALVDSPSRDSSRKDGYAVFSGDLACATPATPVRLQVLGSAAAGGEMGFNVRPGLAVRVLTGAYIPTGADAVVAEEFTGQVEGHVLIDTPVSPGMNILKRGGDAALQRLILGAGQQISPVMAGLIAAAGHSQVPVFKNPAVGIIGTGDEIVAPGRPLSEGELYASNIITLAGWCGRYGMRPKMTIVRDDHDAILRAVGSYSRDTDAVITSGGAWTGDYDLTARVLRELGWREMFHRIRIGPGKAVGFGILDQKPVFILPGGPPSNLMGFLQIALPGLLALSGHVTPGLPRINARLALDLGEGKREWTDFFYGTLDHSNGIPVFYPMKKRSRLSSIAKATAVASIPEGMDHLPCGSEIPVQLLK